MSFLKKTSINGFYLSEIDFSTFKDFIIFRYASKGFEFEPINFGETIYKFAIILLRLVNQFNDKLIINIYIISYIIDSIKSKIKKQ